MLSNIHILRNEVDSIYRDEHESLNNSFTFDVNAPAHILNGLRLIFTNEQFSPFSITLKLGSDDHVDYQIINYLCLILSHPKYFKINGRHLLGVIRKGTNAGIDDYPGWNIFVKLAEQGYHPWLIDLSQNKTDYGKIFSYWVLSEFERLKSDYIQNLLSSLSQMNIFLTPDEHWDLNKVISEIKRKESEFSQQKPEIYKLYKNLIEMSGKLSEYENLNNILSYDVKSKEKYLEYLLKGEDGDNEFSKTRLSNIQKIKNFYRYEYEILPGWYKKIGHIIKVIMGKRSFRSLFNDNVKKYKD